MSIDKQVKTGVKWTTVSTVVLAVVAILKVSVLTRFLDKSDFGLMALVTFVMGFMELFNDMGLTSAILHKQGITKKQYASLYWINWLASIVMYLILLLVTPVVASFYDQNILNTLIPLIGLNLLLSGLGRQYKTVEQKHLLFKTISIIDIVGALLSLMLSVVLAVYGYGVFALVYSVIFQSLFSNLCYFIIGIKKYGLLFHFKYQETKEFLSIGMYQVGGQVVNYFNRDLDILIIGKFFSADILGGYSLARELVRRPATFIIPILNRVGAPALSKINNDDSKLKEYFLKMTNVLASITIPIYFIIALLAYPIVYVLYGESFTEITILVQILTINMIFRIIGGNVGNLVVATGKTYLDFNWNILTLFVTPLFVLIGSQFGIIGVAIMMSLSMIFLYIPSYYYLIKKMINASLIEYSKAYFLINIKQFLKLK